MSFILVRWTNPNDKDITDKTKFTIIAYDRPQADLNGLIPELEYFKKRNDINMPSGVDDMVAYVLNTIEMVEDTIQHTAADGITYTVRQYDQSYTVVMREKPELFAGIDELEAHNNGLIFPFQKQLAYFGFYMMCLKKRLDGGSLTTKQEEIVAKCDAKFLKMWKNKVRAEQLKAQIESSDQFEIRTGWESIDPENE